MTMVYTRDSRIFNNTFHVYHGPGWTPPDLVTIANSFWGWWNAFYKACMPNIVSLVNIHVQVYDPTGSPYVYDRPVSPAEPGTRAGVAESANVTIATSLRAALAGRAYRGRYYLPSISEGDVSASDIINSVLATALANAASQLIAGSLPAGYAPVIFHRDDNLFSTIVSYVIETLIDSQRRRLPGRGR